MARTLCAALWLAWGLYWWAAARGTAPAERSEPWSSRLAHLLPTGLCFIVVFSGPRGRHPLGALGVVLSLAGLAFAVWARLHLGRQWSAIVTVKEGHRLVRTGPYRLARHPIYTGFLLAFLGSALALGAPRGYLAFAVLAATYWRKLLIEEGMMAERFGAEYESYRREVRALVPFVL